MRTKPDYVIEGLKFYLYGRDGQYDIVWMDEDGSLETINMGDVWYGNKPTEQELRDYIFYNKLAEDYPEFAVVKRHAGGA